MNTGELSRGPAMSAEIRAGHFLHENHGEFGLILRVLGQLLADNCDQAARDRLAFSG